MRKGPLLEPRVLTDLFHERSQSLFNELFVFGFSTANVLIGNIVREFVPSRLERLVGLVIQIWPRFQCLRGLDGSGEDPLQETCGLFGTSPVCSHRLKAPSWVREPAWINVGPAARSRFSVGGSTRSTRNTGLPCDSWLVRTSNSRADAERCLSLCAGPSITRRCATSLPNLHGRAHPTIDDDRPRLRRYLEGLPWWSFKVQVQRFARPNRRLIRPRFDPHYNRLACIVPHCQRLLVFHVLHATIHRKSYSLLVPRS
jgi:hypothetical protein